MFNDVSVLHVRYCIKDNVTVIILTAKTSGIICEISNKLCLLDIYIHLYMNLKNIVYVICVCMCV